MRILKNLISSIYEKNAVKSSKMTHIFTKYGLYQAKMYQDSDQEYLAIMSQNFFDTKNPIVYIHSEFHVCHDTEHLDCHCNNQLDLALKMIVKEDGLIVYHSEEANNIDGFLQEINALKLEIKEDSIARPKKKIGFKSYKKEQHALSFILNDLNVSTIQLITQHQKAVEIIEQMGIKVTRNVSNISFGYGDQ